MGNYRYGLYGKKFANSFSNLNNTKLIAIASKSLFKLKKYGDKYRISKNYRFNDYDKILLCDEIDNIYISTINNSHFEIINKAIKLKKIFYVKNLWLQIMNKHHKLLIN